MHSEFRRQADLKIGSDAHSSEGDDTRREWDGQGSILAIPVGCYFFTYFCIFRGPTSAP